MRLLLIFVVLVLLLALSVVSNAQTVTLDYYFNRETHKDKQGKDIRFHYLWSERSGSGFSILGNAFKKQGFKLDSLETSPTLMDLKKSDVYLIVDPDTKKEALKPNYIGTVDIGVISAWVKKGGVLVMFANDSANVELPNFNKLADVFGMHFTSDIENHVIDDAHFSEGTIVIKDNPVFNTAGKIFMKDACAITANGTTEPVLKNSNGATVIAYTKYGQDHVIAIADPWLYNEYVNGRLPKELGIENDKAADDLVSWIKKLTDK
ncbi:DUF4350 domain-containing protein [Pedobacter sp. R-06]|uniref:DUF4350 domain-containing protein n=1 Tax=Pedobacter sp. R-06 TaxID=3404051 RepID=UPI003CEC1399